jgi:Ca2+-binding EF-hand superfamily protein
LKEESNIQEMVVINRSFLITVVVSLFPAIALAQSQADAFHKADLNGDGFIDAKENESVIQSAFKEQDANGDGFIDLSEMENYLQTHVAGQEGRRVALPVSAMMQVASRGIQSMDVDKDGKISADEYHSSALKQASMLDRDQDGRIALKEFPGAATP